MENEDEIIEIEDEAPVIKNDFDAVPIHFRPGKTGTKRIKLVIPGIEPPLLYAEVTGDSPDTMKFEIIAQEEIDSESSEPKGEELTVDEDAAVITETDSVEPVTEEEPKDLEDLEMDEKMEEETEAMDNILEELPDAPTEEEGPEQPEEQVEVKEPVGYLIATSEDLQPQWIEVLAMDGESEMDAMKRVGEDNPDYKPGTLEDVERIKAGDTDYSEDN